MKNGRQNIIGVIGGMGPQATGSFMHCDECKIRCEYRATRDMYSL